MKRYLPTKEQLRNTRSLRFLGEVVFEPNLWHFNRHSVSFAVLIGLFCAFLPIPFQMIPCVILILWVRGNVPLSIAIVWISNPVTMAPIMYFNYRFGTFLLDRPNTVSEIHISFTWLSEQFSLIWQPLLLGSLLLGFIFGISGFALVRIYWRWKVKKDWSMRKLRKTLKRPH